MPSCWGAWRLSLRCTSQVVDILHIPEYMSSEDRMMDTQQRMMTPHIVMLRLSMKLVHWEAFPCRTLYIITEAAFIQAS